jgi:spermidine synthase
MNNDFSPSLMYCTLAYKALAHSKVLSAILGGAQRLNIALAVAISLSVVLLSGIFVGNDRRTAIVLTVAGTGMTSMIGELLLMTVFQVFYGSLFHLVGMLLTLFMAGVAAGSYLATSQKVRECSGARIMVCLECSFIALLLGQVLFVAMLEQGFLEAIRLPVLLGSIIVTGVFTGMTYPVASRLYQHIDNINVASDRLKGTGVIYAVDLLGGGIGGIVGGIIFIPLLGVQGSFLALVLLKTATFLLFIKAWGAGSGWLRCEY